MAPTGRRSSPSRPIAAAPRPMPVMTTRAHDDGGDDRGDATAGRRGGLPPQPPGPGPRRRRGIRRNGHPGRGRCERRPGRWHRLGGRADRRLGRRRARVGAGRFRAGVGAALGTRRRGIGHAAIIASTPCPGHGFGRSHSELIWISPPAPGAEEYAASRHGEASSVPARQRYSAPRPRNFPDRNGNRHAVANGASEWGPPRLSTRIRHNGESWLRPDRRLGRTQSSTKGQSWTD